jgi:hypothetical protein
MAVDQEMLRVAPDVAATAEAFTLEEPSAGEMQKAAPRESAPADGAFAGTAEDAVDGLAGQGAPSADEVADEVADSVADSVPAEVADPTAAEMTDPDAAEVAAPVAPDAQGVSLTAILVAAGVVLAIAGLLLLGLSWLARRTTADPLLR